MLNTIGDSHADFTFRHIPGIWAYHLGPWTMHRVGRDGFQKFDMSKTAFVKGERLICCFGEIDVRCHIHRFYTEYQKRVQQNGVDSSSVPDPIHTLAANYINTILPNCEYFKMCVMSVPPPCYTERVAYNPEFPIIGSDAERLLYQRSLNTKLKELCERHNLEFLDLDPFYADENGMMNVIHSSDGVHVTNTQPLHNKLRELQWIG